jgi:ring-1,2-phenylacetyl-CoA epoxidase subunit PaaD
VVTSPHHRPGRIEIFGILDDVKDPEVPALSVVELGVVRDVRVASNGSVTVVITPTYSGCPAMKVIEDDIIAALKAHDIHNVHVETVYAPAWTTEWMTEAAREKLRAYGIAPPGHIANEPALVSLERTRKPVACPYCGSTNTLLQTEISSTACKAMHVCRSCDQPFEEFKAI